MNIFAFLLNLSGLIISFYLFWVSLDLQRRYGLKNTKYFLVGSVGIIFWNLTELILMLLPQDQYDLARTTMIANLIFAIGFTQGLVFGFIILRGRHVEVKLIIYSTILIFFGTAFILRKDWIDVIYDDFDGWHQFEYNSKLWFAFVLVLLFISICELSAPLYYTLKSSDEKSKLNVQIMLLTTIVAPASNGLWYIRQEYGIAFSFQLLIANVAFLVFFHILRNNPFMGFYDPNIIDKFKILFDIHKESDTRNLDRNGGEIQKDFVSSIQGLNEFKEIMHPIRLSILKHLKLYNSESRVELLKILELSSGNFEYHYRVLEKMGFLRSENQLIEDYQRIIITINTEGLSIYDKFQESIDNFLKSSS